jgi:NAD(P)-dependent dehydrogenase (short-subunit alcohol dehydrogenase family)
MYMGRISIKSLVKRYLKGLRPININVTVANLTSNTLMNGRYVVVTGGGGGFGFSIANTLINRGATIVALGRRAEKLNTAAKDLGEQYIPFVCDVSDVGGIDSAFSKIQALLGNRKIDTLINCAGVFHGTGSRFFEYTVSDYDTETNINTKAIFFWSQAVARYFIANKICGNILNISSILGLVGDASPYGISKWGVTGFTKGLAKELASYGIRVNGIAPGYTVSEIGKTNTLYNATSPNKRWSDPDEIANLALFLLSNLAPNIIGEVIIADGGTTLPYSVRGD